MNAPGKGEPLMGPSSNEVEALKLAHNSCSLLHTLQLGVVEALAGAALIGLTERKALNHCSHILDHTIGAHIHVLTLLAQTHLHHSWAWWRH